MNADEIVTLCQMINETISEMEDPNEPAKAAMKALQNVRVSILAKSETDPRFGQIIEGIKDITFGATK
jgi:hypothetical protein